MACHVKDGLLEVCFFKDLAALVINDFALLVHDIVIFKDLLTNFKVARFDLLLGRLNGTGHNLMLNGLVFFHAELIHDARNVIRTK